MRLEAQSEPVPRKPRDVSPALNLFNSERGTPIFVVCRGVRLISATHHGECDMPLWSKDSKNKRAAEAAKATPAETPKAAKASEKTAARPPVPAAKAPVETAAPQELSSADMQKRREVS